MGGRVRRSVLFIAGAEYAFSRPDGDLSLLFEYLRDHRDASAPFTPFTHGPFAGVRIRFNEPGDAELQYGVLHDRATRILMHKLELQPSLRQVLRDCVW